MSRASDIHSSTSSAPPCSGRINPARPVVVHRASDADLAEAATPHRSLGPGDPNSRVDTPARGDRRIVVSRASVAAAAVAFTCLCMRWMELWAGTAGARARDELRLDACMGAPCT
ncbi:hypothetical protein GUJ93_ZPchr0007g6175 [Zizania palustris]|uniref:Uncharacterized protein n=1 Tax=Zizania palustris TaxID=103762 RepID=A0A8J5TFB7_ZIZPA|nr:hypothetical protein GUJ93_ZPchr0007g6175 [Zizania palustris]